MIGLIGAMPVEMDALLARLENRQDIQLNMNSFACGQLYGQEVVLSICGPGKVNAAIGALSMIDRFHPDWILNLGVAGSGEDGVGIGDLVIATAAVQHDMDTSAVGDPKGYISKIGLIELPCDEALRLRLKKAAEQVNGLKVHEGIVATGDRFICQSTDRSAIHGLFNAKAVEMEGAAVAHVCYCAGVPFAMLRSISDQADGSSSMDYPSFVQLAASHSTHVVENLLKGLAE